MTNELKTALYWGISAVALVAFAGFAGKAAIMLAVLLVVGVLLIHWQDYAGLLNPPKQ